MKKTIILAAAIALCGMARAQQLQTEVNVDRTVDNNIDQAARPKGVVPSIVTPKVQMPRLSTAEYTAPGAITTEICPLPPARWGDTLAHTPYRGYASIGYMPAYNMGVNAGYRLVQKPRLDAGVWMQYCGTSYKNRWGEGPDARFTNHYLSLGADGTWHPSRQSWLTANFSFTPSSLERPMAYGEIPDYRQRATDLDLDLLWRSRAGAVKYHLGAGIDHFSMSRPKTEDLPELDDSYTFKPYSPSPVSQTGCNFLAGFSLCAGDSDIPWLGLDIDWHTLHSNDYAIPFDWDVYYGTKTVQQGQLHPYFMLDLDKLHFRLGANVSVGVGGADAKTHLAPEVYVTYTPAAAFTFYADLTGGEHLNPVRDLYAIDPYLQYNRAFFTRSRVPLRAEGGVNILPLDALRLSVSAGYAVARDQMMPSLTYGGGCRAQSTFAAADFDAWYVGAELGYTLRTLASVTVHAKTAKANKDHYSWIDWADCARHEFGASLHITPTDRLEIDVDLTERIKRSGLVTTATPAPGGFDIATARVSLGSQRLLGAGASYKITPAITAFARLDNLLGCRYSLVGGIPAERLHGLVGAAIKF